MVSRNYSSLIVPSSQMGSARLNQDALKALVGWKNVEAVILGISP